MAWLFGRNGERFFRLDGFELNALSAACSCRGCSAFAGWLAYYDNAHGWSNAVTETVFSKISWRLNSSYLGAQVQSVCFRMHFYIRGDVCWRSIRVITGGVDKSR